MLEWLSLEWFKLSTLQNFHWGQPLYFYGLLGIPALFIMRWLFYNRKNQQLGLSLTNAYLETHWVSYLRFIIPVVFSLGLVCVLLSLARPQKISENNEQFSEGIDIMLALDISDSMLEKDLKPTRLAAAKEVAQKFLEGRFQDRIGLVVFAGEAYSVCPLTTDYTLLKYYIQRVDNSLIPTAGTAIGSALATCINRLRDVPSQSKIAILLSDGSNYGGQLDPLTATDLAKSFGIKIYTIAVGSDATSGELDEETLRLIAKEGKGQFFRATDNATLEKIFQQINKLEKVQIKNNVERDVQDYYHIYLNWGVALLLLSFLLKISFLGNIFED